MRKLVVGVVAAGLVPAITATNSDLVLSGFFTTSDGTDHGLIATSTQTG